MKTEKNSIKMIGMVILLATTSVKAQTINQSASLSEGHGAGNNGGLELSFQSVRVQTLDWLEKNLNNKSLTEKLALKSSSTDELVNKYRDTYNKVSIKVLKESELTSLCDKTNDALICGLKNNERLVCKNESTPARILCVDERLSARPGDEQFSINFHEHLGVAGIETNDESGDYSRYPISSRLMKFANPVVTTRWELGDSVNKNTSISSKKLIKLSSGSYFLLSEINQNANDVSFAINNRLNLYQSTLSFLGGNHSFFPITIYKDGIEDPLCNLEFSKKYKINKKIVNKRLDIESITTRGSQRFFYSSDKGKLIASTDSSRWIVIKFKDKSLIKELSCRSNDPENFSIDHLYESFGKDGIVVKELN